MKFFYSIIFIGICILLSSCSSSSTGSYVSMEKVIDPYFGSFENEIINYHGIERNPVIIVHGFQGSVLVDTKSKKNLWGTFSAGEIFYVNSNNVNALAHPIEKGIPIEDMTDDVKPHGILKNIDIRLLGIQLNYPAYEVLIDAMNDIGYISEGTSLDDSKDEYVTLFEFSYDWRRDISYNARLFEQFILKKRKYLQKKYEEIYGLDDFDVQFNIVSHSMGGLLSRYYLRYGTQNLPDDGGLPDLNWDGSKYIDKMILAGTPNAGYLDTFLEMLYGASLQPFSPAVLGSFPTYYQMLPAPETQSIVYTDDPDGEAVDVFDPILWKEMEWGILNPKEDHTLKIMLPEAETREERLDLAFDHLKKCLERAEQFIRAMRVDAEPPADVDLYLVFGNGIKTSKKAFVNRETGEVEKIYYVSGDGKVTTVSALWDIRQNMGKTFFINSPIKWSSIYTVRAAHMGILNSSGFVDNMLILLPMLESKKQHEILKDIN